MAYYYRKSAPERCHNDDEVTGVPANLNNVPHRHDTGILIVLPDEAIPLLAAVLLFGICRLVDELWVYFWADRFSLQATRV